MRIFIARLLCFSSLSVPAVNQNPNAVFILSDGQGFRDTAAGSNVVNPLGTTLEKGLECVH